MTFSLHKFYVILQIAALGYRIGGISSVSGATTYRSPNGKLNFCRHCNKSVAHLIAFKTNIAGWYNAIHFQTG